MVPKAKKQGFAPAGGVIDVIIVQVLHSLSLHSHHCCLRELVALGFSEIHHVLRCGGLTHLFADLGIGLHKRSKGGEGGLGHGRRASSQRLGGFLTRTPKIDGSDGNHQKPQIQGEGGKNHRFIAVLRDPRETTFFMGMIRQRTAF